VEDSNYDRRFNAALGKAFSSTDSAVRIAYFDLAEFYHRKLGGAASVYPSAELLRGLAKESCREQHCWCK
jgi:hypothetical protein